MSNLAWFVIGYLCGIASVLLLAMFDYMKHNELFDKKESQ